MYLGKQRRDRTVALVLAAALVGVAVLGLLVTLASAGAGASSVDGAAYGPSAPLTPSTSTAVDPVTPSFGSEAYSRGDQPPLDPQDGGTEYVWRLVGTLVGVVLLFGCGILITREQRRRAEDDGSSDGPGEWIS
ncbi:MAG: hypothetical protein M3Y71_14565 [Actinomycetota bacterium]|nr:hypothetical protein [Actinomycetota bacterium]